MPYFLDFLSRHEQSHLLLFWLEVGACVRHPSYHHPQNAPTRLACDIPPPFTYFTYHRPNQYNTEVFELAAGGGSSLVTQATRIHNSYLGEDAPKRIDLPTGMQAFIQEEVAGGAPNINVFGAAHAWVYRRLKQTWYPAFLMSSTYQALLEHLKKVQTKRYGVPLVFVWWKGPSDVYIDIGSPQTPTPLHAHTHKKSFTIPLRDLLVDEVQSRYLEAFLLNCDARFPPAAIGNVYLWKKVCM